MKDAADYFQKSSDFNLLREMDRIANFLEFGVMHKGMEKLSRFIFKLNPLKTQEDKELFFEKSDRLLEHFNEMSKKTSSHQRKSIAEDMSKALKSIFSHISKKDIDKLFSVERIRRQTIKKISSIDDFFTYRVTINLPNFYAVNRSKDYTFDSMNLFSAKFINLVELLLGKKMTETEKSKLSKQYVVAEIDSLDDKKTLAKFECILANIMDRQHEIKTAMTDMFNALNLSNPQENSRQLVFA